MAFECFVCHGNGHDSGSLVLNCSHQLCLKCYTKTLKAQGEWHFDILTCIQCKKKIANRDKPNKMTLAIIFSYIRTISQRRRQIAQLENIIVEDSHLGKSTDESKKQLDETVGIQNVQLTILREMSEPWGTWTENERLSYLSEESINRIHLPQAQVLPNFEEHPYA